MKRILCNKITRLIEKTTKTKGDLVMVNCCNYFREDIGYKGKSMFYFKFHIRVINSEKHEIDMTRIEGHIYEEDLRSLPYIVANEWYYRTGRKSYMEGVFRNEGFEGKE